jgi:hypothetical protein
MPPSSSLNRAHGDVGHAVAVEVADVGDRGAELVDVVELGREAAVELVDLVGGP